MVPWLASTGCCFRAVWNDLQMTRPARVLGQIVHVDGDMSGSGNVQQKMAKTFGLRLAAGAVAISAWSLPHMASAQEVKAATKYGDMSTVTQDMLTRAGSDGTNFLHTNGDYAQLRFYPEQTDQSIERRTVASRLDLPDGGEGVDGDHTDHRERRDVRHHLVQPRLRARCTHR